MNLMVLGLALGCAGCGERPLKVGVPNWQPQSVGGPIETRPLPPANRIHADYQKWLGSGTSASVRLYQVALQHATNQLNYTVDVGRGETPLGAIDMTFVTFTYSDPTNGEYQLEWHLNGRHTPDFLKLEARPKIFWLQLFGAPNESKNPRLKIVAIERVESRGSLVAEPGGRKP